MVADQEVTAEEGSVELQKQTRDLEAILALMLNQIFGNHTLVVKHAIDVNNLLIQTIEIVRLADFNEHSKLLNDALFSTIFILTKQRMQSRSFKYLDLCVLNEIADCLVDFLGKLDHVNTVY